MNVKSIFIFLFLFAFSSLIELKAQSRENDFDELFAEGQAAFKKENYELAYKFFNYCSKLSGPGKGAALKARNSCDLIMRNRIRIKKAKDNLEWSKAKEIIEEILKLNPKDSFARNEENQIEEILKSTQDFNVERQIAKKSQNSSPNSFLAKAPKENEFELTYAKGIFAMRECNYRKASEYFLKAHKMKPQAYKTKQYYLKTAILDDYFSKLNSYKKEPSRFDSEIVKIYESIIRINSELEDIQGNSSCIEAKGDFVTYLQSQIPPEVDHFNCHKVQQLKIRINGLDPEIYKKLNLESLPNCNSVFVNNCNYFFENLNILYVNAKNLSKNQNFSESIQLLEKIYIGLDSSSCDFSRLNSLKQEVTDLLRLDEHLLQQGQCRDIQLNSFRIALNLEESGQYLKAIDILDHVDFKCLDEQTQNLIQQSIVSIQNTLNYERMKTWEDSASKSRSMTDYINENNYLNKALSYSISSNDSIRIENKLVLNECYLASGKKCEKILATIEENRQCRIDSSKYGKLKPEFIFGYNPGTLFKGGLLNQHLNIPSYNNFYHTNIEIGLRLNKINIDKKLDYRMAILYEPGKTVSYGYGSVQYLNGSFSYSEIKSDVNIKYHTLKKCPNKFRPFIGLSFINSYTTKFTHIKKLDNFDAIGNMITDNVMYGIAPFLGVENPEKRVSCELVYSRSAVLFNTKDKSVKPSILSDRVDNSISLKMGIRL